ncbi:MAG TPA: glycosyltransferase [Advenella sp.]|nr:glycosyltransferase [Advenella sp.]
MKKRLAFIVDVRGWAFDIIARHVKEELADRYDITLYYWEDYPVASHLLQKMAEDRIAHAHFFFREQLKVVFETVSCKSKAASYFNKLTVTTHIPDYLYSSEGEFIERKSLFDFVNGYFVTNADLQVIYEQQDFFSKPDGVIIDWPISEAVVPAPVKSEPVAGDPVRIMWTGNSKWGEYAGYRDYKGLETIIKPAIKRLQDENYPVRFTVIDSAEQKRSREDVLTTLAQQDILLVASLAEGTPLTLIEAMSLGVAVVSTPVGIAREVLPAEYMNDAVIERSADKFYETLKALMESRQTIAAMKTANQLAFKTHFASGGPLREQWLQFLQQAAARTVSPEVRQQSYKLNRSMLKQHAINGARTAVFFLKRAGLIRFVHRVFPMAAVWYNRLLHGSSSSLFSSGAASRLTQYEMVEKVYRATLRNAQPGKPVVVYAPMWKGVAASTESLFGVNRFKFPYFDDEYPETVSHPYLDRVLALLLDNPPSQIIYSGGSVIHITMAEKVRERAPQIQQYFLWHGSPAQWVEPSQLEHFNLWHKLYNNHVIDGVISVKPDLEKILNVLGIKSFGLINPIPDLRRQFVLPATRRADDGIAHIGVFSAVSSWYKNPFVQLLATLGQENWTLHTNVPRITFRDLDFRQLGRMESYEQLPRPQFISLLASLDLNLYVTNTECSPMVVLECSALGVPCIVGPAGDIFSGVSDELADYLVEPHVDNAYAIYERMKRVLANRTHIQSLLQDFVPKYNARWSDLMDGFYLALEQDRQAAPAPAPAPAATAAGADAIARR